MLEDSEALPLHAKHNTVCSIDEMQVVHSTMKDTSSSKLLKEECKVYTRHVETRETSRVENMQPATNSWEDPEYINKHTPCEERNNQNMNENPLGGTDEFPTGSCTTEKPHTSSFSHIAPQEHHNYDSVHQHTCYDELHNSEFGTKQVTQESSINLSPPQVYDCNSSQQSSSNNSSSCNPAFALYVDDENELNRAEANPEISKKFQTKKEKRHLRSKVLTGPIPLRKFPDAQWAVGGLKIPKQLHRMQEQGPDHLEACESLETSSSSGLSRIEQSFTVHTKEAMKVIHGLFTSPQIERNTFEPKISVQNVPKFTIHKDDSIMLENGLHVFTDTKRKPDTVHTKAVPSNILCDDSRTAEQMETVPSLNVYTPENSDHPFKGLGIDMSYGPDLQFGRFHDPKDERLPHATSCEHDYQETGVAVRPRDCRSGIGLLPGSSTADSAEDCPYEQAENEQPFKMPSIPYVPSPGITKKQLDELCGTEDKENGLASKNKGYRTSSVDHSKILQPSKHIPCMLLEDYQSVSEADDEDLGVGPLYPPMSDETCTTRVFSCPLLSSTPFFNHAKEVSVENAKNPDVQQDPDESFCALNLHDNRGDKDTHGKREMCITIPGLPTPAESLSVIMETSKEYKSSSSSGSSNVTTKRHTFHLTTQENLPPIEECSPDNEENVAKSRLSNTTGSSDIRYTMERTLGLQVEGALYPFSSDFVSKLLIAIGFPAPRHKEHYMQLDVRMPVLKNRMTLGSNEYLCSETSETSETGETSETMKAIELKSGRTVTLKVRKSVCPWEYYITEEIKIRLKDPAIALYYTSFDKAYIYKTGSIMVTEHSQYGSLCKITDSYTVVAHKSLPPAVVMYWAYEMLDIVKHLHKCGIIHGDMTGKNFIVQNILSDTNYKPSLKLSNFGEAIDMTLFPAGTTFNIRDTAEMEMLSNCPGGYQMDFLKLAATVYFMLFGNVMKMTQKDGKWSCFLTTSQHQSLWAYFFSELLNVESWKKLPDLSALQDAFINEVDRESLMSEFMQLNAVISRC